MFSTHCASVCPKYCRTCSEQCAAPAPKTTKSSKTSKKPATVVEHVAQPVVQQEASKVVEKHTEPKKAANNMKKLRVGTSVMASFIGSGTMKGKIKNIFEDTLGKQWMYVIEFPNGEEEILPQGVSNKNGKPAKKNQAVPIN
jgi:hypothetical protein